MLSTSVRITGLLTGLTQFSIVSFNAAPPGPPGARGMTDNICRCIQCSKGHYTEQGTKIKYPGKRFEQAEAFQRHVKTLKAPKVSTRVCSCPDCSRKSFVDPTSGYTIAGRLFSAEELLRHEWDIDAQMRARGMLPVGSDADEGGSDQEHPPDSPRSDNRADRESHSDSSDDIHGDSYHDDICLTLRSHIERLDGWEEALRNLSETLFVFAADKNGDPLADCTLDPNTPNPALSYQTFLSDCQALIKKGNKSDRVRHRVLAKTAQKHWEPAFNAFEALKSSRFQQRHEVNTVQSGELSISTLPLYSG
ncbi:hypothetical protein C8F04DRAFT_1277301 [Mycena alexandri]|uniref:Uncharacterized protein n=1 Tax=Mycena alexandri TaxID=1745969 RepID=A0AAD6S1E9_9AGAR|nr:hypothetical protein C8F04DRAFT_1277301 [Mycena alexandri]